MIPFRDIDLILEDVSFQNFLTFGPMQTVLLSKQGLTVIIGENLDIGENERNGVGKSTILDAIAYCLFGKALRDIPNGSLVNREFKKRMLVVLHFRINGFQYRVERGENPGLLKLYRRPVGCQDSWSSRDETGVYIYDISRDKTSTTKTIIELIGLDLDLFGFIVAMTTESTPYYKLRESQRQEMIENLFGFTQWKKRAEHLSEVIRKDAKKKLIAIEAAGEATRQANERIQREIDAMVVRSDQWEKDITAERISLNQLITRLDGIDFDAEMELIQSKAELEREISTAKFAMESAKKNLDSSRAQSSLWETNHDKKTTTLNAEIQRLSKANPEIDIARIQANEKNRTDLESVRNSRQQIENKHNNLIQKLSLLRASEFDQIEKLRKLQHQLIHFDAGTCPTCGQDWQSDQDNRAEIVRVIAEMESAIADTDDTYKTLNEEIGLADTELEIEKIKESRLSAFDRVEPETFKTVLEAMSANATLEQSRRSMDDLLSEINPHLVSLEWASDQVDEFSKKYDSLVDLKQESDAVTTEYTTRDQALMAKTQLESAQHRLREIDGAENPYQESLTRLRNDAQKSVDHDAILALRRRIEHYTFLIELLTSKDSFLRQKRLSKWVPKLTDRVNYYLNRFELPYTVEFFSDTSVAIRSDTGIETQYNGLSRGQRSRLWMATNFGFQDVWEKMNRRINISFIDEFLDNGISERGAARGYEMIEEMALFRNKTMFLITHRQDLADRAERVLKIEMQHKISKIIEDY